MSVIKEMWDAYRKQTKITNIRDGMIAINYFWIGMVIAGIILLLIS